MFPSPVSSRPTSSNEDILLIVVLLVICGLLFQQGGSATQKNTQTTGAAQALSQSHALTPLSAWPDAVRSSTPVIHTERISLSTSYTAQKTAPADTPAPYGPPPLFFTDGDVTYRATHFIALWDANLGAWQAISPNLTENDTPGAPGYSVDGITAIAHDHGVWYTGTLAGQVSLKLPGHQWSVLHAALPERTVTSIAILPGNTTGQIAALGYGGYGTATPNQPGHVYITEDGGATWADVTGNLPDAPVQSLHFALQDGMQVLTAEINNRWYSMHTASLWTPMTAPAL